MIMNEKVLERYIQFTGDIFVVLLTFLFFTALSQRRFLNQYLVRFFGLSALFSILEWVLIHIVFVKKYGFLPMVAPLLDQLGIDNMNFTAPVNYLIKFIFIGLFFRDSINALVWKKVFQASVVVLVVFELIQVFVFKTYKGYDSLASTIKNIFFLFGGGLLLYRVYIYPGVSISLTKNSYFWIGLGLVLPTLAELFLEFIFTKLYETDTVRFYSYYLYRNASQLIGFTLLMIGAWQAKYLRFLPKEY